MQLLYKTAAVLIAPLCKLCGLKVYGKENIPQGYVPIVAVGNHSSLADPIILGCAFLPRQIFFVAKKEFENKFLLGKLFSKLGAIYVDRNANDLSAIKKSVAVLKENKVLGIFAEGKRYKGEGLTEFKQGPVFIAYKGDSVIVPVGIRNASHLFCFWKRDCEIRIGQPILIDKSEGKLHEIMDIYTDRVKKAVEELI